MPSDAVGAPPAKAENILDRFVEVTGGKAAYGKLTNRVTKMIIEPVGSGMQLNVTTYATRPNKTYSVIEAEALGRMEKGTNGTVVWESSLMTGPVVKDGQERAFVLRASVFDKQVNWRELYRKVDCVGVEDVKANRHTRSN